MTYAIHSLSPAFWYVVDAAKYRERDKRTGLKVHGRCQISPPFASRADAETWMRRKTQES